MREPVITPPQPEKVTRTFTRLAPWMLGSRLVVMASGIVVTMILTRTLSTSEWNSYSLLKNMWTYVFLLGQLGLVEAALRFVAELSVWGDAGGIKRLIGKILSFQTGAVIIFLVGFILLRGWLETTFNSPFGFALVVMVLLGGISIVKETLRQTYTALYRVKLVAFLCFAGALLFPVAAYVFIPVFQWGVSGGLAAEATDYVLTIVVLAALLPRLRLSRSAALAAREEAPRPVSNYRIARYSGAIVANNLMMLILGPQTTLFLVGYFLSRAVNGAAGVYNLAVMLPRDAMMFLVMAVVPLLQTMLTRTCEEDRSRLPELLRSYHRFLILMLVPIVVAGCLFMDKVLLVLTGYKEVGIEAGPLAMILLPLNLVYIIVLPISAGLRVVEKVQRMIVPQIISGVFDIGLMVLFLWVWPTLGSMVVSRYITNIGTAAFMTYLAVRQVGGLYFPVKFFIKSILSSSVLLLLLPLRWFLWQPVETWSTATFGKPIVGSAALLLLASVLAVGLLAFSARLFHLIGPNEIKYFKNARVPGMNILMRLLVRRRYLAAE